MKEIKEQVRKIVLWDALPRKLSVIVNSITIFIDFYVAPRYSWFTHMNHNANPKNIPFSQNHVKTTSSCKVLTFQMKYYSWAVQHGELCWDSFCIWKKKIKRFNHNHLKSTDEVLESVVYQHILMTFV